MLAVFWCVNHWFGGREWFDSHDFSGFLRVIKKQESDIEGCQGGGADGYPHRS
jgi:hypothetical protein